MKKKASRPAKSTVSVARPDRGHYARLLEDIKDRVVAEYALSGINKPIGVSSYQLTRALPASLKSALPTVEEIEAELAPADASQEQTLTKEQADAKATKKRAKRPRSERQA